jgi:hypothetical protein
MLKLRWLVRLDRCAFVRHNPALEDGYRDGLRMARTIGKLTALAVDKAKRRGYYGDGGGLFLQVSASGSKSWVFRFKEAGKLREMGLGATHTIGLAEAREKVRECRRLRLDGIDPIEARKVARAQARLAAATATTFKDCAERYIASHQAGWRSLAHAAPSIPCLARSRFKRSMSGSC